MAQTSPRCSPLSADSFLPAALELVRPCPARSEYIELCFSTSEGPFQWCFPAPPRDREEPGGPLALAIGPYGVQAHRVDAEGGLGATLRPCTALPMILTGADVRIASRLVTTGRTRGAAG
ncbi:hypothetical protein [Actinomadura sp. 9N407]|uniref:hypothetical protein n=1 Tax=Actinomadura sp. 9N407 TaxID=3375154 RepID=UPI00378BC1EE